MLFQIRHSTRFSYPQQAYESHNEARMKPADGPLQRCLEYVLTVEPPAAVSSYRDYFGNWVDTVSLHPHHGALEITMQALVETMPAPRGDTPEVTFEEFLRGDRERGLELYEYLAPSHYVPFSEKLRRFFWQFHPQADDGVADWTNRLLGCIRGQFEYEIGKTQVDSNLDEILTGGGGVCQDFAHLTIGLLRLAGIPTRYVSGYLAPIDKDAPGEQASHAWVEAQLPGEGWVGLDPTHCGRVGPSYIRVAIGRDYADVPPLRGVFKSASFNSEMVIDLSIRPAAQTDRQAQWGQEQ